MHEHGSRPTVCCSLLRVPQALCRAMQFLEEYDVVSPGNFCHSLWHKFVFHICRCFIALPGQPESAHAPDVSRREPFNPGKVVLNI